MSFNTSSNVVSTPLPVSSRNLLLARSAAEAVRNIRYLKKDGIAVVNTRSVMPVTESLNPSGYDGSDMVGFLEKNYRCIFVDSDEVCAPFGSAKFFNIILLGIASGSGKLGISPETITGQIEKRVPEKYAQINKNAFLAGIDIGKKANSETE